MTTTTQPRRRPQPRYRLRYEVLTHIAGSSCTVFLLHPNQRDASDYHPDAHYLDARDDVRWPDRQFIECVRSGQVYFRVHVSREEAPAVIVQMMRDALTPTWALQQRASLQQHSLDRARALR